MILDGKKVAAKICDEIHADIQLLEKSPKLGVILV
jgi:5,10-methylene-tetrahydrofolate dehydrogenase/methenyl tetrahydrofolate cyclohydrolase